MDVLQPSHNRLPPQKDSRLPLSGAPLDLTCLTQNELDRASDSPLDLSLKTRKRCADTTGHDDDIIFIARRTPEKRICYDMSLDFPQGHNVRQFGQSNDWSTSCVKDGPRGLQINNKVYSRDVYSGSESSKHPSKTIHHVPREPCTNVPHKANVWENPHPTPTSLPIFPTNTCPKQGLVLPSESQRRRFHGAETAGALPTSSYPSRAQDNGPLTYNNTGYAANRTLLPQQRVFHPHQGLPMGCAKSRTIPQTFSQDVPSSVKPAPSFTPSSSVSPIAPHSLFTHPAQTVHSNPVCRLQAPPSELRAALSSAGRYYPCQTPYSSSAVFSHVPVAQSCSPDSTFSSASICSQTKSFPMQDSRVNTVHIGQKAYGEREHGKQLLSSHSLMLGKVPIMPVKALSPAAPQVSLPSPMPTKSPSSSILPAKTLSPSFMHGKVSSPTVLPTRTLSPHIMPVNSLSPSTISVKNVSPPFTHGNTSSTSMMNTSCLSIPTTAAKSLSPSIMPLMSLSPSTDPEVRTITDNCSNRTQNKQVPSEKAFTSPRILDTRKSPVVCTSAGRKKVTQSPGVSAFHSVSKKIAKPETSTANCVVKYETPLHISIPCETKSQDLASASEKPDAVKTVVRDRILTCKKHMILNAVNQDEELKMLSVPSVTKSPPSIRTDSTSPGSEQPHSPKMPILSPQHHNPPPLASPFVNEPPPLELTTEDKLEIRQVYPNLYVGSGLGSGPLASDNTVAPLRHSDDMSAKICLEPVLAMNDILDSTNSGSYGRIDNRQVAAVKNLSAFVPTGRVLPESSKCTWNSNLSPKFLSVAEQKSYPWVATSVKKCVDARTDRVPQPCKIIPDANVVPMVMEYSRRANDNNTNDLSSSDTKLHHSGGKTLDLQAEIAAYKTSLRMPAKLISKSQPADEKRTGIAEEFGASKGRFRHMETGGDVSNLRATYGKLFGAKGISKCNKPVSTVTMNEDVNKDDCRDKVDRNVWESLTMQNISKQPEAKEAQSEVTPNSKAPSTESSVLPVRQTPFSPTQPIACSPTQPIACSPTQPTPCSPTQPIACSPSQSTPRSPTQSITCSPTQPSLCSPTQPTPCSPTQQSPCSVIMPCSERRSPCEGYKRLRPPSRFRFRRIDGKLRAEIRTDTETSGKSSERSRLLNQKRHRRSMLDEIANSVGYVGETRQPNKGPKGDLFADPALLSREERALQKAMLRFSEMETGTISSRSAVQKPKRQSNTRQRANQLKRKALRQSPNKQDNRSRNGTPKSSPNKKGFVDFQPEVLTSRTRMQSKGIHSVGGYNRDAAYENELVNDDRRRELKRARRRAKQMGNQRANARKIRREQTARDRDKSRDKYQVDHDSHEDVTDKKPQRKKILMKMRNSRKQSDKKKSAECPPYDHDVIKQEAMLVSQISPSKLKAQLALGHLDELPDLIHDTKSVDLHGCWEVRDMANSESLRQTLRSGRKKGGILMKLSWRPMTAATKGKPRIAHARVSRKRNSCPKSVRMLQLRRRAQLAFLQATKSEKQTCDRVSNNKQTRKVNQSLRGRQPPLRRTPGSRRKQYARKDKKQSRVLGVCERKTRLQLRRKQEETVRETRSSHKRIRLATASAIPASYRYPLRDLFVRTEDEDGYTTEEYEIERDGNADYSEDDDSVYDDRMETESDLPEPEHYPEFPEPPELRKLNVNKNSGETVLHRAARLGYEDVALYCLRAQTVDVNVRDNAGYTPLHEACVGGQSEMVRHLLGFGANPNACTQDGVRPIQYPLQNDKTEMVRLMMSYGADPLLDTTENVSSQMIALINAHLGDINGYASQQEEIPWTFYGSSVIEEDNGIHHNLFTNLPSDEEDEDIETMFECSDAHQFVSYRLKVPEADSDDNYVILPQILDMYNMTRAAFLRELGPLIRIFSLSRSMLEEEIMQSSSICVPLSDTVKQSQTVEVIRLSDVQMVVSHKASPTKGKRWAIKQSTGSGSAAGKCKTRRRISDADDDYPRGLPPRELSRTLHDLSALGDYDTVRPRGKCVNVSTTFPCTLSKDETYPSHLRSPEKNGHLGDLDKLSFMKENGSRGVIPELLNSSERFLKLNESSTGKVISEHTPLPFSVDLKSDRTWTTSCKTNNMDAKNNNNSPSCTPLYSVAQKDSSSLEDDLPQIDR